MPAVPKPIYAKVKKVYTIKRTPLRRSTKPINKVAKRRAKQNGTYERLKKQFLKENPVCMFEGCEAPTQVLHHAAGRIEELLYDQRYFRNLCHVHHDFVENNPEYAKEHNYSVERTNK